MIDDQCRVGFVHDGTLSDEQEAALSWLRDRTGATSVRSFTEVGRRTEADVLWWHRDAPLEPASLPSDAGDRIRAFLDAGGGVLLTQRAMAGVDALGIDSVPPDTVMTESVVGPTGVLWRSAYDDHPAVATADGLRLPICDRGTVPVARYERVLPAEGEVLASTVRNDTDVPDEMTVVSWDRGGGVLGMAAPLSFTEPVEDAVEETRNRVTAGCLSALAGDRHQPSTSESAAELRALRSQTDDAHRPGYHFTPPANWLNDPNGLVEWNGRYHIFYQYNPAGPFHNTIHWGHAVSDDLLHWEDEPIALTPSPDGPDRDGCWSGCAVEDDGTVTLLYTGGNGRWQLPCLATADDQTLRSWTKHGDNPVIEEPPSDMDLLSTDHWAAEFRDHSVWRDGDTWYHVIGSGHGDGGVVLLYTSENLSDWEYEGPLLAGDDGHGTVWECPEVLDLGDAQLLHVSDYETVRYFLGEIRDTQFHTDRTGVLDHGDFYAPQSLRDGDRYLTWGWLPETRDVSAQWDAGWSGALSLPRVLSVGPDGDVRQRPAAEVTDLRNRRHEVSAPTTLADERHELDASGRALELRLTVALDDADAFELSVLESPDCGERTVVRYTRDGEVVVDRSQASADNQGATESQRMAVPPYDDALDLRVFVDRSVVEVYANERHCLTSRVYPSRPDSTGVAVAAEDGRATLPSLAVWELEEVDATAARSDPVDPAGRPG